MKYEDIPDHCYYCGRLGHSYPSCTEYMRASDESNQPPPLPYENVLRGTTHPNHGPFGLLLNPFLLNSTPTIPHPNVPTLNPTTNNLISVHHPRGQWGNLSCSVSPQQPSTPGSRSSSSPSSSQLQALLMISTSQNQLDSLTVANIADLPTTLAFAIVKCQGIRNTLERLDWAVGNSIWHSHHPSSGLNHLDFFGSDHKAIQIVLDHTHHHHNQKNKNKRFLFKNVWLTEPTWNDVLLDAWSSNVSNDDPSNNLLSKQSGCAKFLSNWKNKAFFGHFPQDIIDDILSLPPPDIIQMDSYFWQHTSSGHYSVKTGYHVAKTSINLTQPSSSNTATLKRWWNSIWSLQIPPKITHFIYRLSQKSIPTAENFYRYEKGVVRNAFVFRNQCENSKRIQQEAQEYLDLYQESQKQHQNRPQPTTDCNEETWAPPPIGFLKLNVDGAISSQWGKTGIGALVRDSTGQVIAARASNRMGQMPPKVAEGWALLEGLRWCSHNHINIHYVERY
ncbi:hypothetical protein F8388_001820 [Cannabis sativa]|uniref:CCHC-type domain-containing protein n=1 Tax=Cannabis sativa TaxID=3483 RepID=A0A7J6F041_CANSA|nr:hypothetical protein F8388_001820 [Cannabis sativa]KAF4391434.1 hypothetical protein G4B88_005505 [Cannabis sativa]